MLEFYLNTTSPQWFGLDGNPFRDNNPSMAFQSRDTVKIIACTETPEAGEENVDPTSWPRDVSWAAISGIGAKITVDNDYIHKLKGTLATEVSAGSTASISATIENASYATVPASGTVRLFDASGNYEAIAYTARNISGNTVVFTTSGTLTGSYGSGATMDCDQSPYCEAYLDTAQSNLEQGEFVFQLVVDSPRLREEMDYTNTARLDVQGLEMLVYKTVDGNDEPVKAYLCDTFSITGTIGNVGYEAEPPDPVKNQIAGIVNQLAAAGFEVEQQYDESGNTQFRFRSSSAGGTWSQWITVSKGEKGDKGDNFTVNATGLFSERQQYDAEGKGFSFLATDNGNLYVKNSDTSGDWSDPIPFQGPKGDTGPAGPANTLSIGTVTTGPAGTEAAATITGTAPNQTLNLTIPRGDTGAAGSGTGDLLKSVYDTNDDGIVDHAATADTVGATAAAQVADAVGKAHTHANKATLDKFGEANGKPTFDGAEIGGGSGTVKSVNGQLPDGSGNVTIETGGGMTARLVSGEVAASAGEWLVFTAAGSVTLPAGANLSEVKITAETAGVSVLPASGEAVAGDNGLSLDMPGYTVLLQFRETARNWVPVEITAARPSVLASSEEKPAIPDDGLVFYVPLESAEAATGQPIGNNGVTFTPDAVLGRDVAVFDGSANLSFTPTGMPSGTAPHTKSLWIKFNGDTGQVYVLAWGSNGSDSASTITARNNKWAWCFAGDWEETDVDVPAGQWLNVTTTHSAGVNKLYVNGTLRNTHSRNLNISGNSGTIGSFLSGSEKITGTLAALRVYDRVLTADEIAALAAEFTI